MLGHGKHNLPDKQQQADPLVCVQCVRRDREDHGQHVVPDGRHLDNRTDIYVQRLRPAGEADVYGRGRGDAHRTRGDEPDVRREREHPDRGGDGGVQREYDEDADV